MQKTDILIVGGGINGCGIARDAAGRGYDVCLVEMNDLASGTSSWSTKLIHGGLRYLEHYAFRLVREALVEREILLTIAPHLIHPMRFILPYHAGLRPAWLIRFGLFLYDTIGSRKVLAPTKTLDLRTHHAGEPLKPIFTKGFEYSDCWVDDARLVVLNAVDAAAHNADIRVRTQLINVKRKCNVWQAQLLNKQTGAIEIIEARILINAAGPWVDRVLNDLTGLKGASNVRMVQGSHIIVNKLFDHDHAYIFQNSDRRVVFAIPFAQHYTLIGTTDRDYHGDPSEVTISPEEIDYLCKAVGDYFKTPVTETDKVWDYSGVRPLFNDGASAAQEGTRDYVFKIDDGAKGEPSLINIFGGKITTYRKLAESILEKVESRLGAKAGPWTATSPLPGGAFAIHKRHQMIADLVTTHPFLTKSLATRLINAYGTRARLILEKVRGPADLGEDFSGKRNAGLFACEIDYLMDQEWAHNSDDLLWRRSKLGINADHQMAARLQQYMERRRAAL